MKKINKEISIREYCSFLPEDHLARRQLKEIMGLLLEARDALPAISMVSARINNVDLSLGDRIEDALEPWVTSTDDPDGI